MNARELLAHGRDQLRNMDVGALEAEILLCDVLGVSRAWLFANPEEHPTAQQCADYLECVGRRKNGEPIAYLTGKREFWSLPLKVTPDVLIPRPETELLVETALDHIPVDSDWRVADLGTGSGAIAIAIAVERPGCEVHATEYSEAALSVAVENGLALAKGKVQFHHGSWLTPLDGHFQVILSNPPYVAADDEHLNQGDCRFEPGAALTPGSDAMASIREISHEARKYLAPGGMLAFEHGYEQGNDVRQLLKELGFTGVKTINDLEGRERVTLGMGSRV